MITPQEILKNIKQLHDLHKDITLCTPPIEHFDWLISRVEMLEGLVPAAYIEGSEDMKDYKNRVKGIFGWDLSETKKALEMNKLEYSDLNYQISVMQAYRNGKKIEFSIKPFPFGGYLHWIISDENIEWDWHNLIYRIKPEQKEKTLTKECFEGMPVVWLKIREDEILIVRFGEDEYMLGSGCGGKYPDIIGFEYSIDRLTWNPCKDLAI